MSREIMQQALDAFEDVKAFATDNGAMPENWDAYYPKQYDALEALRQELAKPEQEEAAAELRRLHEVNAELFEALKELCNVTDTNDYNEAAFFKAESAIAKAEGSK